MDKIFRLEHHGEIGYALENPAGPGWHRLEGDPFGEYTAGAPIDPGAARVLPPVEPSKIVAVGLNYRDHAREMDKPLPPEPPSASRVPCA